MKTISNSIWFKIIAGIAFLFSMHYQNVVEIQEVKAAVQKEIIETKVAMLKSVDEKYVSKDYLNLIIDDIQEIKINVRDLKGRK